MDDFVGYLSNRATGALHPAALPRLSRRLTRETGGELVLVPRLRAALERLNPALSAEGIAAEVDELIRDRSTINP